MLDPACGSGTFLYHAARKILRSPQIKRQHLTDSDAGAIVVRLVNGFDIHPVAVSIARATLLRALPHGSVASVDELRIWQGDSLMLERTAGSLFNPQSNVIEVPTPQGDQISVPLSFAESPRFASELRRIVTAAQSSEPLPLGVGRELDAESQEGIAKLHAKLSEVCANEGDSVWTWYLANYAAPFILARNGVDRIVANPPWVRMSDIQVPQRKRALETRISELALSAGGKNATGFDIAGLFVDQCRAHYLKGDSSAAGWVLNWASMKAGNWSRVREKHEPVTATYLDFSKVKHPPFTGAKACAWIQKPHDLPQPDTLVYSNRKGEDRVIATDTALEFKTKTNGQLRVKRFGDKPSQYAAPASPSFAQGATITPSVLVKLSYFDTDFVATTKSKHKPWKDLATQKGRVPDHYIRQTLFSSDLLMFGYRQQSRSLIPLTQREQPDFEVDSDGNFDFSRGKEQFWNRLNELYERHRGKGAATPKTLWERLNYQNILMKQFSRSSDRTQRVAYNTSGQELRAARFSHGIIIDSGCYYISVPEKESAYITATLNAPCLQFAFAESRESDRHFHLHPLNKVPIPLFNPEDSDHRELVELCEQSEVAATEVISGLPDNTGQIKASNSIRKTLLKEGLADAIDEVVRRVLPSHSVMQYTTQSPHPWENIK